jgi:hypothetical protein
MPSSDSGQFEIEWPARWQREAIEAVLPHLGSDERLRILLDDPKKAIHGTLRVTSSEKVEIARLSPWRNDQPHELHRRGTGSTHGRSSGNHPSMNENSRCPPQIARGVGSPRHR